MGIPGDDIVDQFLAAEYLLDSRVGTTPPVTTPVDVLATNSVAVVPAVNKGKLLCDITFITSQLENQSNRNDVIPAENSPPVSFFSTPYVKHGQSFRCIFQDCVSSRTSYKSRMAVRAHAINSHHINIGCISSDYKREKRCILITGTQKVGKTALLARIANRLVATQQKKAYWQQCGFNGILLGDVAVVHDICDDRNRNNKCSVSSLSAAQKITVSNLMSIQQKLKCATMLLECTSTLYNPDCIKKMQSHDTDFIFFNLNATATVLKMRRQRDSILSSVIFF
jgi:hypothetical protein